MLFMLQTNIDALENGRRPAGARNRGFPELQRDVSNFFGTAYLLSSAARVNAARALSPKAVQPLVHPLAHT